MKTLTLRNDELAKRTFATPLEGLAAPPNIVLFLASDLGYGDLACYGHARHKTPNLDRLAAGGVRFVDCHSNGCMCSPSRAALLTGRYQQHCGIEFVLNHAKRDLPAMAPGSYTYGHALRAAGYATGFFGTYHTGYLPDNSPLDFGFDEFKGLCGGMDHHSHVTRWGTNNWWHGREPVNEPGYSTDLITNHALHFLEQHRHHPFCLHIADFLVHFPWQGPHDGPDFQLGKTYDTPEAKYGSRPDRQAAYGEMVEAMDRSVGRVLERLDALGLTRNTFFFFGSDHGGHALVADNGPLGGAKGSLHEGGHRIPAIASWPGRLAPGGVVAEPVMLMDLLPTFMELGGATLPAGVIVDGVSLCPLLQPGGHLPPRPLFWRHGSDKAIRKGPWKLLVEGGTVQLFNLDSDLAEKHDLASEQPGLRLALERELNAWDAGLPALQR